MSTYERLIDLLDDHGASYRTIDHAPEGRTDLVSRLRGHAVEQAAKCVVVLVKVDKKTRKYVLAVVPGHVRVDLDALKALYNGRYAGFADNATAERLATSVSGTILPVTFTDELELVVDPLLLRHDVIFFNAARLDRSLALATEDYRRIAQPRVHPIAQRPTEPANNEIRRDMEANRA
ncbi:YbaK/prolyl-tRNA synthetase associated domain-containing protein [Saccharopolyspora sp. K220]|uniref:YbaK/EbsC family protein n=1 Tax=Saccharopolyspora soli TaxID=2926618 RepID=UPI001F59AF0D|nr:YbaK/EbsC family protein [Saccharopolyspora soli]MCI2422655.1 YbaK/prolyl-tRNA synthetase associated domain-containing protein [Saccharopolyspora soli]